MAFINAVVVAKVDPPLEAAYHWIEVPVAVRSATVALPQKSWLAEPVGADGIAVIVTVTSNLEVDSHPLTV